MLEESGSKVFEVKIARRTPVASHTFPVPLYHTDCPRKFTGFCGLFCIKSWEEISLYLLSKVDKFLHFLSVALGLLHTQWHLGQHNIVNCGQTSSGGEEHFGTFCHISMEIFLKNTKRQILYFGVKVVQDIVNSGHQRWRVDKMTTFLKRVFAENMAVAVHHPPTC